MHCVENNYSLVSRWWEGSPKSIISDAIFLSPHWRLLHYCCILFSVLPLHANKERYPSVASIKFPTLYHFRKMHFCLLFEVDQSSDIRFTAVSWYGVISILVYNINLLIPSGPSDYLNAILDTALSLCEMSGEWNPSST